MQLTMLKNINRYFLLLLAMLITVPAVNIYADGSKDLYPSGVTGRRAFLRSSNVANDNWPFPNIGTHYVYAKAGERITLASSLQATGSGAAVRIRLYSPTGAQITLNFTNGGRIQNRAQEIAGPQLSGGAVTGRYTPVYFQIPPTGGDGVYRVEFVSTSNGGNNGTSNISGSIDANNEWSQSPTTTASTIAAWDVSVINTTNSQFIPGRVYTNVLNLSNGSTSANSTGFYGLVYVQTKDGYSYKVDNNGNNGMYFTFFVNNNGFVDAATQLPIYKSINETSNLGGRVHNPNNADVGTHITHKLFYTPAAGDLPPTARIAVTNNGGVSWTASNTWLKTAPLVPEVSEPTLTGVEGEAGQVSNKGGYIKFNADVQGNFKIEIISVGTPSFPTRTITGQASAGSNSILWDGKDGAGNSLPTGTFPAKVTVQLQGAEVHFPFFDMEYNRFGTIIELTNGTADTDRYKVYWDDTDIYNATSGSNSNPKNNSHLPPTNSAGLSSQTNGHIWGVGGSGFSGQFGDEKSIDTWTFITGEKKEATANVTVRIADLKITEISHNKGGSPVEAGDVVIYTVKVKNGEAGDGNSDVTGAPFTFTPPVGFVQEAAPVFTTLCEGSESTPVAYNPLTERYESVLNLKNGCEITYTFTLRISDSATPESAVADATILRPNDVTDPDATNTSNPEKEKAPEDQNPFDLNFDDYFFPPTNPYFECEHNGLEGGCNNIKSVPITITRISDLGIEKSVDNPTANIGDVVTFTLKVTNHGPHKAMNIVVTDVVPSGYTEIANIDNDGALVGSTITWNIAELENSASKILSFKAKVIKVADNDDYLNKATVTGAVVDPNQDNNESIATVAPCEELNIFTDDFGVSDPSVDNGRRTSEYMPLGSFKFGTSKDYTTDYYTYMIDNDHYALVAPGYIKQGTGSGYYFWTPAYDEANTVTDRSGTVDGAVMVINAGNTLQPFYERPQLLQVGATYRASFWLYLVKGPTQVAIDVKHAKTREVLGTIKSDFLGDWNNDENKWHYIDLYFTVPVPDDKESCEVDNVIISFRNNNGQPTGNDYYIDDISLDKVCSPPDGTIIIDCPDPEYKNNYWHGTIDNDWEKLGNWTGGFVPDPGEDIEFATELNNPTIADVPNSGPAKEDLHLGADRVIGDLINDSDKDLWVTTGDQLTINGEVKDGNTDGGTIVVKASPDEPSGTLIFADPSKNGNVGAIVEFYNQAYDCADCGFYTRSWQYFGIPVNSANFPYDDVTGKETVNQWVEPFNGDKWQPAPYTPDTQLKAFKGYQMTNDVDVKPSDTYSFSGTLNVANATVQLTRTDDVNYPGVNLVGNSYTAAIPINATSMGFPTGVQQTVYLFNTGTRDQWRKLNGEAINLDGYRSGQYLAVPVGLGGTLNFPDRIPSMHSFMLLAESGTGGNLTIDYSKLVKNTTVNRGDGTQIATRSAGVETISNSGVNKTASSIPYLVMDVIGEQSADRVWIFTKKETTHGFDNGWDGRKMTEGGIAQLYVAGVDESQLQVATVPNMDSVTLGFIADIDGKYTLEFSLSDHLKSSEIYLQDLVTGAKKRVTNGDSYSFEAKKGETATRFSVTSLGNETLLSDDEALIFIESASDGKIVIRNKSTRACTASISNVGGTLLKRVEVNANSEEVIEGLEAGMHVVRLQNAILNDARKVVVK